MREKSAQHRFDAPRRLVGRDRTVDFATQLGLDPAAASDQDMVALDLLLFAFLDLCREETDVADIVLGAGIRTTGQVDV